MSFTIINKYTYHEVNTRSDGEGPVAAEMGIGDVSAHNGGDPNGANPVGDVVSRLHSALMQLVCQIQHQI